MSAFVALVSSCVFVVAEWACSLHKSICEEAIVLCAVGLYCGPLLEELVLVEFCEDVLCNVCLLLSRCSAEVVEFDLEPVIHLFVQLVVFVAELLWCDALKRKYVSYTALANHELSLKP